MPLSGASLPPAPNKMEDDKAEVQDPLLEVNLGDGTESRPTFISKLLSEEQQSQMVALLCGVQGLFRVGLRRDARLG